MPLIKNLLRKKTKDKETEKNPTALCCFYDGRFDTELSKVGLNLIGCKNQSAYRSFEIMKPKNITFIEPHELNNYSYDFIICNDIIKQREAFISYSRQLHIPGIIINHEPSSETQYHLKQRLKECNAEMVSTEYGNPNSILYATEELTGIDKNVPVLIEGDFQPKDYPLLDSLHKSIPEAVFIGNNPGLDFCIGMLSYEEYREYFARCEIFVNLPTQRNISHQLLWAMSNGAFIISLKTPMVTSLLNSSNSVLCNHPQQVVNLVQQYKHKNNPQCIEAKKVNDIFPIRAFQDKWKHIINTYNKKVYTYEQ